MLKRTVCILSALCMLSTSVIASSVEDSSDIAISDTSVSQALSASKNAISLIKNYEGFTGSVYNDLGEFYIGYGTSCNPNEYPNGITQDKADELLRSSLISYEAYVNKFAKDNNITLNQNQFDALLSFAYNFGSECFSYPSRLRDYLINGSSNYSHDEIVNAFGIWCHHNSQISKKLIERRLDEATLFLSLPDAEQDTLDYNYIIFDPKGGSIPFDIVFYPVGENYRDLPKATHDKYEFDRWMMDNDTELTPDLYPSGNITVYAQWIVQASSQNDSSATEVKPTEADTQMNMEGILETAQIPAQQLDKTQIENTAYSDVISDNWYYSYVTELSKNTIISGYPDGSFRPEKTVTCGEVLKLILLAANYKPSDDVVSGSHWATGYYETAIFEGIIDDTDIPDLDEPISRSLVAKIAVNSLGLAFSTKPSPFYDTTDGYVVALYAVGIVEGSFNADSQRVYMPESSIKRSEISAIVWRINNADQSTSAKQILCNSTWIDVLDSVPVNTYSQENFYTKDGIRYYKNVQTWAGIDVSSYQTNVDWGKVKAAGIDFAIIRVGYRGYTEGGIYYDNSFETHIKGALAAGLDVGVYFFSQAITEAEAIEEADFVLKNIKKYDITYPVVFDWEYLGKSTARTTKLDTKTLCAAANAFCKKISDAGYTPMIYFTNYSGLMKYDLSQVVDYGFWFAKYGASHDFYYDFDIWQYTDKGKIDGVPGNVDVNISFTDYSKR